MLPQGAARKHALLFWRLRSFFRNSRPRMLIVVASMIYRREPGFFLEHGHRAVQGEQFDSKCRALQSSRNSFDRSLLHVSYVSSSVETISHRMRILSPYSFTAFGARRPNSLREARDSRRCLSPCRIALEWPSVLRWRARPDSLAARSPASEVQRWRPSAVESKR